MVDNFCNFVSDRNNAPIVSIIPATIYLSEHSPDMTTILSFTITDVDVTDSVSCFFDVWPLHGFAVFAFNVSSKYKVVCVCMCVCVSVVTFMHKNNEGRTGHIFSITVHVIIIIFRLVDSTTFTVCFQTLKYLKSASKTFTCESSGKSTSLHFNCYANNIEIHYIVLLTSHMAAQLDPRSIS